MQKEEEATRQHVYCLLGVFYLNRRVLFNFVRENNVYCIEQKLYLQDFHHACFSAMGQKEDQRN